MPTRQTSSSGRPKSPRVQVVLPEDLCDRLAQLAELESRTVSNMAKVLIQQGVERFEQRQSQEQQAFLSSGAGVGSGVGSGGGNVNGSESGSAATDRFRAALEQQQPRRLRGAPRRLRLQRPN